MAVSWRYFNSYMTAQDLSDFDDYLSHVLLDTVGTEKPLGVHHMKPRARPPAHDPTTVMKVIRKRIIRPRNQNAEDLCFKATDSFLELPFVVRYLKKKSQEQTDAFATHAWRYFKLYLPFGTIEIAHTSRYTFRTKKSELCVLAIAPIPGGEYIEQLEGSMARLTPEEDAELSRTRANGYESRRDFSVVQILGGNRSLLFLGPARFVNHDCNANCELERKDKVMRFKTKRAITAGEEITAHYADDYFGKNNRECLCQTCEENGRGGWTEAGNPVPPPRGRLTPTPESPTAKRLKVSRRTLKIESSDSSRDDGAHAGSSEDEDIPLRITAKINRKRLQSAASEDEERKTKERRARQPTSRLASTSTGSHIPGVKYPQMRRNLPRGPGGQFRRKKSDNPPTPQSESEASDDGSNGDDEKEEHARSYGTRSARRASTGLTTASLLEPMMLKVEPAATPTMGEMRKTRTTSISASRSSPSHKDATPNTSLSTRSRASARHFAMDKPLLAGDYRKVKQETPAPPSIFQEVTICQPNGKLIPNRHRSTPDRSRRHIRSSKADSDDDDSEESDDSPKRVLRPRTSRGTTVAGAEAKMEISPTAPHIRQLKTLQKRTEKTRPTWKGWVSIPNGACDVCFQVHDELKGREPPPDEKLVCNRCKRHQAIYGEKWPYRENGVFTDLSSTTSDGEESSSSSSEGSAPIRSNRLLKKRRAEKAAQLAASAASALHISNPTHPRIPSRGRNGEVGRRARRARKTTKSESGDSSSPEPQPSRRKSRKRNSQVTSPQKNISATTGKAKEKDAEPLSKKRKVTVNAVANHVASATAATAASNQKKGGVGTPHEKELARAVRARTRLLLKDNPDLDLDEIKVAAAAGVMRSGRARGAATEKMPVTGPPIAMMPKRKRAVISEDDEEDILGRPTRRIARMSSAKSNPSKNEMRKTALLCKTRNSMPGPISRAKRKLTGGRWDPDDSSNESDIGAEKKEISPANLAVRRPLLSFTPNPTFFALRKRALSDPAAAVKSHEDSSSLSSSPVSRARGKVIISGLSSDGRLSEDEHSAPRSSPILHLSSSYIPHAKDALSDAMDISDIDLSNAHSESSPAVAASLMQDKLTGTGITMEVDVTEIETERTPDTDGISSDLTVPSLTSSVPSSASSTSVGTPQVPLVAEPIIIRDDSPTSTTSSPTQASKKGNVRTYQTWKRSHAGIVSKLRPS